MIYGHILYQTPETGKSTIALQFAAQFQRLHPNGNVAFLDLEGATADSDDAMLENRVTTFGIDLNRFFYQPLLLTINEVFDLIDQFAEVKRKLEERTGKDTPLLIIWD